MTTPEPIQTSGELKTNWKAVWLYYFLACAWSWPFFWWRDIYRESWNLLPVPLFAKSWLIMWGPGLSALFCFLIFKHHRRLTTFRGTSLLRGWIFFGILPTVLALLNRDAKFLMFGFAGFVSTLGEELGWRGFLQDALKIKSRIQKAFIIGVMWELWHFTNRTAVGTFSEVAARVATWILITSLLSYVILKLTDRTHSLLIAVTLHAAFNVSFEFENGWQAVAVCVPFWIWLVWRWPATPAVSPAAV